MKKAIIILLALSLHIGCQNSKEIKKIQETNDIESIQSKEPVQKAKKRSLTVNYNSDKIDFIESNSIENVEIGENKVFSFKFIKDRDSLHLIKINIYQNDKIFQTIKTNKECYEKKHQFIDWNFDGYKDITVLSDCGSGGCTYWIWNYDSKEGKFIYNSQLFFI